MTVQVVDLSAVEFLNSRHVNLLDPCTPAKVTEIFRSESANSTVIIVNEQFCRRDLQDPAIYTIALTDYLQDCTIEGTPSFHDYTDQDFP